MQLGSCVVTVPEYHVDLLTDVQNVRLWFLVVCCSGAKKMREREEGCRSFEPVSARSDDVGGHPTSFRQGTYMYVQLDVLPRHQACIDCASMV